MKKENLKTPAILLNIDALENNIKNIKKCVTKMEKNYGL